MEDAHPVQGTLQGEHQQPQLQGEHQQPLHVTKLYSVKYNGVEYIGPQLAQIVSRVNATIPDASKHLAQASMSMVVRGLFKRGWHKGATGRFLYADASYTLPPGAVWVPAYEAPSGAGSNRKRSRPISVDADNDAQANHEDELVEQKR